MPIVSDSIAALVLAAGGGKRLGGGKLLLPWKERPLIAHTLEAVLASGAAEPVIVVLGHEAEKMREAVCREFPDHNTIAIVVNSAWEKGQSASLRAGLDALAATAPDAGAALVLLGDQPTLRSETIRLLAESHREAVAADPGHPATAPTYRRRRGNPVILSRVLFDEARDVRGDKGAREILAGLGGRLLLVPVDDAGVVRDIDTPESYVSLTAGAIYQRRRARRYGRCRRDASGW